MVEMDEDPKDEEASNICPAAPVVCVRRPRSESSASSPLEEADSAVGRVPDGCVRFTCGSTRAESRLGEPIDHEETTEFSASLAYLSTCQSSVESNLGSSEAAGIARAEVLADTSDLARGAPFLWENNTKIDEAIKTIITLKINRFTI